jgi:hypothetical protein
LTPQDLRGVRSARGPHTLAAAEVQAAKKEPLGFGYWTVEVVRDGRYRITMQFEPIKVLDAACSWSFPFQAGEVFLRIGDMDVNQLISEGANSASCDINLQRGKYSLDISITGQRENGIEVSPFFAVVECLELPST